jgi:hypothetical protein
VCPPSGYPQWSVDVLQADRARIDEGNPDFPAYLAVNLIGCQNTTRGCGRFQSGSNVDAVTQDVIAVNNDVAHINSDSKFNWRQMILFGVAGAQGVLDRHSALHCIDNTGELRQRAVTHDLENTTPVFRNIGLEDLTPDILQPRQRRGLVRLNKA